MSTQNPGARTARARTVAPIMRVHKIARIDTPAGLHPRVLKNPCSRSRRFRNRVVLGDSVSIAFWLLDGFRGAADIVFIDLRDFAVNATFRKKIRMLFSLSHELLGDCGSIFVRCNAKAGAAMRDLINPVFGTNHFAKQTQSAPLRQDATGPNEIIIQYGKTCCRICNLAADTENACLENIILSASGDDSLVAGFFHGQSALMRAAEKHGRRWLAIEEKAGALQKNIRHISQAQMERHAAGKTFRAFDVYRANSGLR